MTATLDQQLLDLCSIHGLTSISVHAYNASHGTFMGINVHSDDAIGHSSSRTDGLSQIFAAALLDLRAKQGLTVPAEFAPMEVKAA